MSNPIGVSLMTFSSSSQGEIEDESQNTERKSYLNSEISQFDSNEERFQPTPSMRKTQIQIDKDNHLWNFNQTVQREIYYKKLLSSKETKLDAFFLQGINHYFRKLFDYKVLFNHTNSIIDLSSTDIKNKLVNHILVCGGHKQGIEFLIEEVRKLSDAPICIISQHQEMLEQFERISVKFINIFCFIGNPLNMRHLKNANLKQAQAVLVLSDKTQDLPFGDSQSIIISQFIRRLYPQKKIITEIMDTSKLCLIEEKILEEIRNDNERLECSNFLSKELMSGKIFFSQQMDLMAMNKSTEPHLPNVFLKMLGQQVDIFDYDQQDMRLGSNGLQDVREFPNLISLKVPRFMHNQDYWQLFEEMFQYKSILFLGIFTNSFQSEENNNSDKVLEELKMNFKKELEEERKKKQNQAQNQQRQRYMGSSHLNFMSDQEAKNAEDDDDLDSGFDWFKIDKANLNDNLPLLILNPPKNTKLNVGDYILALGSIEREKIVDYLLQRGQKFKNKSKIQKNRIEKIIRKNSLREPAYSKETLTLLAKEFNQRVTNLTFNIDMLNQQNQDLVQQLKHKLEEIETDQHHEQQLLQTQ